MRLSIGVAVEFGLFEVHVLSQVLLTATRCWLLC